MEAVVVIIVVASIAIGLMIGIRSIQSDWMEPPLKGLPLRERQRLDKLARSQQPIADPELSRKAEAYARWIARGYKRSRSPSHMLVLALVFIVTALLTRDEARIALEAAGICLLSLVYLWGRRIFGQLERTAQLNGWSLYTESG